MPSRPRQRRVYRAEPRGDGGFAEPQALDSIVNADLEASNFFVDPDERYVVFAAIRPEGRGGKELYISWRRDGSWPTPRNLGNQVNTAGTEFCPFCLLRWTVLYFARVVTVNGQTSRNIYEVRVDELRERLMPSR